MSVYDPTACFTNPGRLVVAPTGPFPGTIGGTSVGYVRKAKLVREATYDFCNSETLGRDAVSAYGGRYKASLVFVLAQFDPTVLNLLWAASGTSAGGYQGANVLSLPQTGRALQPGLVTPGSPLLFLADNVNGHPSAMIYAPFWIATARQEIALALGDPLEHDAVVVVCGSDATNRDLAVDLLQNLSPT